ncbi:MAG: hypothetical protein NTX48_07095 [Planctomycetales bacterium]|nr:hypothetical protein [Planctomycetales bacterium]
MELRKFDALFNAYCDHFVDLDGLSAINVEQLQYDFDFHLRECLPEMQQFVEMLGKRPSTFDNNDAKLLFAFFSDALNHLIAARRLLEDVESYE